MIAKRKRKKFGNFCFEKCKICLPLILPLIKTITEEDHQQNVRAVEDYFKKTGEKYKDLGDCWNGLREKMQSCLQQATDNCNNFGV